jgi:hypothetical protein
MNQFTFSLTPALSLRERGNRSPRLGKIKAVCCSVIFEIYNRVQRLFPLPKGEGKARIALQAIQPL